MASVDYYEILGVTKDASTSEIKKAFRYLARLTHPDANPDDPDAARQFRAAAEAYEVLSDPDRRRHYDRGETLDLSSLFGAGGLDDLIRSVFGDGGLFGAQRQRPARGRDVLVQVEISLAEAAFGSSVPVQYPTKTACTACGGSGADVGTRRETCADCAGQGSVRMARRSMFGTVTTVGACPTCGGDGYLISVPCTSCHGNGSTDSKVELTIEVPPGVASGTRLRLGGRGESGGRSGPDGDLFVQVMVTPDDRFERFEDDLVYRASIGVADATLGTRLDVPSIGGGSVPVEIEPGTQPGHVILVAGQGMTRLGRRGRGDMHVVVGVAIPTRLTEDQEEVMRRWAELEDERSDKDVRAG
jgi:molecular chaperone DnaJ